MGRAIIQGKIPYIDLFDHKGPVIFIIQVIGQSIHGRFGVWIIEVLFLFLTLILIYKISRFFLSRKLSLIVPLSYLALFSFTIFEGNLTEEYSNPISLICIYFAAKYFLNFEKSETSAEIIKTGNRHPAKYAFIYGTCFALIAFMRLNNAVAIVAITIVVLVILIIKNEYKNLIHNTVAFLAGFMLIFLPIAIYFAIHGAFTEMIMGTFIFNFIYATVREYQWSDYSNYVYAVELSLASLTGILGAIVYGLRKRKVVIPIFIIVLTILTIISVNFGQQFRHYLTLTALPYTFGIIFLLRSLPENIFRKCNDPMLFKRLQFAVLLIISIGTIVAYSSFNGNNIYNYLKTQYASNYNGTVESFASVIPSNDIGRVMGYNTDARWFLAADIVPCNRYFTLQDIWATFDKSISDQMDNEIINNPPKWIVTTNANAIKNDKVKEIIFENYEKFSERLIEGNTISIFREK
jgi:hypothetical protein